MRARGARFFAWIAISTLVGCARESQMAAPERGDIQVNADVRIHYEKIGNGPQVIIVPARLYLARDFAALARADRTLIFYDMRNRGASSRVADGSTLTILADVRDLEAVRAHFKAERVSLIGYSYLGLMVALYASEHPERVERMVQIGPVPRRFDTPFPAGERAGPESLSAEGRAAQEALERAQAATPPLDQSQLCEAFSKFFAFYLVGNPANASRVASTCSYENELPQNLDRHLGFHFADIQKRDFPAARFAALRTPTLTIHGTLDRNAPYGGGREWARTLPDSRLITVPGGAHNVWIDDPAVVSAVDEFLDGKWPARAERLAP